jgi:hypothetical protein
VQRALRNSDAPSSMTLLLSATVAATGTALHWPVPGILPTRAGSFGLLFTVRRTSRSVPLRRSPRPTELIKKGKVNATPGRLDGRLARIRALQEDVERT